MAAREAGGGVVSSTVSHGGETVVQGPAASCGAALSPQPSQNQPAPAAEERQNQRLVAAGEAGQSGEAPPGRKAVSELLLSAGLLQQLASSSGNAASPSPVQASGLVAPPGPRSPTRCFDSADPSARTHLGPGTLHNAAQHLQDAARKVVLQQAKSAAATALPPARLLPPKQLETICIQVQPDPTKENERPLAAIQAQNVTVARPVERNAKVLGLGVANPQIIRIQPLTGAGPHQFVLHNSSGPTIQLLLQRPLHPQGQVSADKRLNEQRNEKQTPNSTVVSVRPANSVGNGEKKRQEQKLKKTPKVKTRSGRISRPPKYKAKDYKFIKTEDLADCHQSDSDDYSELSVEEDEQGKEKELPLNYDLQPKLFKCQTCVKSYIGKGGLARHYKLNPDHGPQEASPSFPTNSLSRIASLEVPGKANGENNNQVLVPPPVTVTSEKADATKNGQQSGTGGGKSMFAVPQKDVHLLHFGPGRPRQPRRRGCRRNTGRSRCSASRPGQFPSKSLNNISAEHLNVSRRKARLKELVQQCTNEDFIELAAPHFTAFVSVFEFLLMKVKRDDPAKMLFPDVYREFEDLHAMVMKMCQEYFSNAEIKEPVEIKNPKVAESLGINSNLFGEQNTQAVCSPEHITIFGEQVVTEASGKKRAAESSDEMLPLSKRSREPSLLENSNGYLSSHGVKELNATNEDLFLEESSVGNTCCGNRLEKEHHESLELEAVMDCENPDLPCQPVKTGLGNMPLSRTLGLDCCPSCLFTCDDVQPSVSAESLQERPVNLNSSWSTASIPRGSESSNPFASAEFSQTPDPPALEENSHNNEEYQPPQEENESSPVDKKVEPPKNTASADELEEYLSSNATAVAHLFENTVERAAPL